MTKNDPTRKAQIQNQQKPPEIEKNAMDEKVSNLTSLNAILVKKMTEKKQENETLVSEKEVLKSELARSGSERDELCDELGKVSDENLVLEMKSDLVRVYLKDRFKELGLDVVRLGKEKDGREDEIRVLIGEKNELSEEIDLLKSDFDVELSALRSFIKELEGYLDESLKEEKAMKAEIDALKNQKESEVEKSKEDMIKLEERFRDQEAKLIELVGKANELMNGFSVMEKDCEDKTAAYEKLTDDVEELRNALVESDKVLGVEKFLKESATALVSLTQKSLDETKEELKKVKTERESLCTEKNALASQSESLKSEKAVLEDDLVKLGEAKDALEKELEAVKKVAERSLEMLKSTVSSSQSQPQNGEIGTDSYEAELESLETDLKNRDEMIAEMRREAQQAIGEAHRERNIWTLVSSLTSISAAVSFFHAARTR